jgi:uncharacterized RmlC-like cupin family protein
MQLQSIRVVRPDQLDPATAQTPGSQRLAAIHSGAGIESPIWGGLFRVEPGARTGIHHHGEQDTIVYVLSGSSYVRWGEQGEFNATAQAGDFLYVPAWLPHQEINPSSEAPFLWVVVRSTPEPIVVNQCWRDSSSCIRLTTFNCAEGRSSGIFTKRGQRRSVVIFRN